MATGPRTRGRTATTLASKPPCPTQVPAGRPGPAAWPRALEPVRLYAPVARRAPRPVLPTLYF